MWRLAEAVVGMQPGSASQRTKGDARDLLRAIAPELGPRRAEAEHVADLLKAALKDPHGSRRTRRNDAEWKSGGLWSVLQDPRR